MIVLSLWLFLATGRNRHRLLRHPPTPIPGPEPRTGRVVGDAMAGRCVGAPVLASYGCGPWAAHGGHWRRTRLLILAISPPTWDSRLNQCSYGGWTRDPRNARPSAGCKALRPDPCRSGRRTRRPPSVMPSAGSGDTCRRRPTSSSTTTPGSIFARQRRVQPSSSPTTTGRWARTRRSARGVFENDWHSADYIMVTPQMTNDRYDPSLVLVIKS